MTWGSETFVPLGVQENVRLLRRYRLVEQEAMRGLAGWCPAIASWEGKHEVARVVWEDAIHVDRIRKRLNELPGGKRVGADDTGIALLMKEVLYAPGPDAFLAGLFLEVKTALAAAYRTHLTQTSEVHDAGTVYLLHQLLNEEEGQIARVRQTLPDHDEEVTAWREHIGSVLRAIGGIQGKEEELRSPDLPERPPFRPPTTTSRDEGQRTSLELHLPDLSTADPLKRLQVLVFSIYMTEINAAESVGTVLYEVQGMPWEFYYETAKHFYDETRHARIGEQRLRDIGADRRDIPLPVGLYAARAEMDPADRYALVTLYLEQISFKSKQEWVRQFEALGDKHSADLVRYDIADERQHVRYGAKWSMELLRHRVVEEYNRRYKELLNGDRLSTDSSDVDLHEKEEAKIRSIKACVQDGAFDCFPSDVLPYHLKPFIEGARNARAGQSSET